jgi:hypothetical protein
MELTRRSFLAGLGSVTVGLLFARKLDAVLDSLERDLVAEQQAEDQQPSAAEIVVVAQMGFRPQRLIVATPIAALFVIENIRIGLNSQFTSDQGIPGDLFRADATGTAMQLETAQPGTEIRFRVRYVGDDPRGAVFRAALLGTSIDDGGRGHRRVLPIDSVYAIVG